MVSTGAVITKGKHFPVFYVAHVRFYLRLFLNMKDCGPQR